MYNERKDSFSIKDIIVQVLCILLFIFLLIWLFPTKNFIKGNSNNNTYNNNGEKEVIVNESEQVIDTIFNYNVQTMKEAAISYYTTSRLPIKVGDTDTMTLRKMLSEKLILSFLDSDNKQCDLDNSYVQITKANDEYTLKVNLICPASKSDYIIVHLGCYDYCKGNVCEKKTTTTNKTTNKTTKTSVKVEVKNNNTVEVNQTNNKTNENKANTTTTKNQVNNTTTQTNNANVNTKQEANVNIGGNNSGNITINNDNRTTINQNNTTINNTTIINNPEPKKEEPKPVYEYQYKKTETVAGSCYWTTPTTYQTYEKTGTKTEYESKVEKTSPICDTTNFDNNKLSSDKKTCTAYALPIEEKKTVCTATEKGTYTYNATLKACIADKYNDTNGGLTTKGGSTTYSGCTKDSDFTYVGLYETVPTSTTAVVYKAGSTVKNPDRCTNCSTYLTKVYKCTKTKTTTTGTKYCSNSSYEYINGHCYYKRSPKTETTYRCAKGETYNSSLNRCEITTSSICPSGYTKNGSSCEKTVSTPKTVDVYGYVSHTTASEYVCGASTTKTLEKWSASNNDASLIALGYKYTGVSRTK